MRIMCSGGIFDQPIEHTECLQCALNNKGRQPCGLSYPLLNALYKSENGEERRGQIHVTNLTGCLTKAWFEMTQPQPFYPHERLVLFLGKAVHEMIERSLEGDPNFASETALEGMGVVGRADLIGQGAIVDLKTTRWLDPGKGLPYGSHQLQVNIYGALYNHAWDEITPGDAPIVTTGQVQYIDMSGPTTCRKCRSAYRLVDGMPVCPSCGAANPKAHMGAITVEFPLEPKEEVAQSVRLRAGMLADAIETGNCPEPEESWLCTYCSYWQYCPAKEG